MVFGYIYLVKKCVTGNDIDLSFVNLILILKLVWSRMSWLELHQMELDAV